MGGKGTGKSRKDEAECHGPQGLAEMCQGMMSAEMRERCGGQMREMISRCMTHFRETQEESRERGDVEA